MISVAHVNVPREPDRSETTAESGGESRGLVGFRGWGSICLAPGFVESGYLASTRSPTVLGAGLGPCVADRLDTVLVLVTVDEFDLARCERSGSAVLRCQIFVTRLPAERGSERGLPQAEVVTWRRARSVFRRPASRRTPGPILGGGADAMPRYGFRRRR